MKVSRMWADIHPALIGHLMGLPKEWTKEQRDRFIEVFIKVLDWAVPIVDVKNDPKEGK